MNSSRLTRWIALGAMLQLAPAVNAEPSAKADKPWFDARSLCIFPLAGKDLPQNSQQLGSQLSHGWDKTMRPPDPSKVVQLEEQAYPALKTLRIDLTDASIPTEKSDKVKPNNKPQSHVGVGQFELSGSPLLCDSAKLNFSIRANDAQLDLERDRGGKPILLLTDAQSGTFTFRATATDLAQILVDRLRQAAGPYGVSINSATLRITADNPHSVSVDLYVATQVELIPAGLRFKAHVEVDDQMNAKLTELTCSGDRILGPLIGGLLRPGLAKYDGVKRPLIGFSQSKLHLHDVTVRVDDAVHLDAVFGS